MLKKVKKYGNTLVITFNTEDSELYGIREGDVIDLTDLFLKQEPTNKIKN